MTIFLVENHVALTPRGTQDFVNPPCMAVAPLILFQLQTKCVWSTGMEYIPRQASDSRLE